VSNACSSSFGGVISVAPAISAIQITVKERSHQIVSNCLLEAKKVVRNSMQHASNVATICTPNCKSYRLTISVFFSFPNLFRVIHCNALQPLPSNGADDCMFQRLFRCMAVKENFSVSSKVFIRLDVDSFVRLTGKKRRNGTRGDRKALSVSRCALCRILRICTRWHLKSLLSCSPTEIRFVASSRLAQNIDGFAYLCTFLCQNFPLAPLPRTHVTTELGVTNIGGFQPA
jgi:hypothetical protein